MLSRWWVARGQVKLFMYTVNPDALRKLKSFDAMVLCCIKHLSQVNYFMICRI